MSSRSVLTVVLMGLLLAGAVTLRLLVGVGGEFGWPEDAGSELVAIRIDRVWSGVVVGAALAVGGVMLQSLLRNPLASPDLIGAASGAGLAVTAWVLLSGGIAIGAGIGLGVPAVAGALGALAVVYLLGQRRGFVEPVLLVLVGVMVSVICGAGMVLLSSLMRDGGYAAIRWSMGSISDNVPRRVLAAVSVVVLVAVALGVWLGRAMDVASLSEEEARSMGVPLERLRMLLFVTSGVLTAGAVMVAGPIGFVGLVCPHVVRLIAGPRHGVLVVGSALAGAALVVGADVAVRLVDLGSGRLPLGVFTALVGGPVFIWMLRRRAVMGE